MNSDETESEEHKPKSDFFCYLFNLTCYSVSFMTYHHILLIYFWLLQVQYPFQYEKLLA